MYQWHPTGYTYMTPTTDGPFIRETLLTVVTGSLGAFTGTYSPAHPMALSPALY
jgi:hypothetical protein